MCRAVVPRAHRRRARVHQAAVVPRDLDEAEVARAAHVDAGVRLLQLYRVGPASSNQAQRKVRGAARMKSQGAVAAAPRAVAAARLEAARPQPRGRLGGRPTQDGRRSRRKTGGGGGVPALREARLARSHILRTRADRRKTRASNLDSHGGRGLCFSRMARRRLFCGDTHAQLQLLRLHAQPLLPVEHAQK